MATHRSAPKVKTCMLLASAGEACVRAMFSGTPVRMVRPCATCRPSATVIFGVTVILMTPTDHWTFIYTLIS
jgi:hypothetical protein